MLVQQIQMAVSAGYLNHQILNQPLAPQTLVLLNQLLQQVLFPNIKLIYYHPIPYRQLITNRTMFPKVMFIILIKQLHC